MAVAAIGAPLLPAAAIVGGFTWLAGKVVDKVVPGKDSQQKPTPT